MTEKKQSNEENQLINFLKSNVPKSEVDNVEAELRKDFILAKIKGKKFKKKKAIKKVRSLSRKEKKSLGLYNIPRNSMKYSDALPMYKIWTEYISQVLDLGKPVPGWESKAWDNFIHSIYKADFYGSMLRVVRSKCPSYVDKKGICIMDTRNTFKIVSEENTVITLPKKECVFEFFIENAKKLILFGKHLCVKPAERSTKKIKCYIHPDL